MKRLLVTLLSLGLVVGSVAGADAKTKRRVERTVEGSYGAYPAPVTGCNSALGSFRCMAVQTRLHESYLTAKVVDTHGQPVFVEVTDRGERVAVFCGETAEPIEFRPGAELDFHLALKYTWLPGVPLECPGNWVKTVGTIRVTLSNMP